MIDAANLANGGSKSKRRELDFYPTPPDVTHAFMRFFNLERCTVWEPACGDGAMAEVIGSYGHAVIATDLRNTGYGMGGVDFLNTTLPCDAIITNPPFAASEAFIRHAVTQAPVVAMVLKSQYWHAAKRRALFDAHPPSYVLPLTWRPDFMNGERGGSPTMDVVWTVWERGAKFAVYQPLSRPLRDAIDTAVNLPHNAPHLTTD